MRLESGEKEFSTQPHTHQQTLLATLMLEIQFCALAVANFNVGEI